MNKRMIFGCIPLIAVGIFVSCASMAESTYARQLDKYTDEPDGVNDNMLYGYINTDAWASGSGGSSGTYGMFNIQLVPIEYEVVIKTGGPLSGFQKEPRLEPKLTMIEQAKLLAPLEGMIRDNVFSIENIPPGEYYIGGISRWDANSGEFIVCPKPEEGTGLKIEAGQMHYWGAYNIVLGPGDEEKRRYYFDELNISMEVSTDVTQKEVASTLLELIPDQGWDEQIKSEMQ